MTEADTDKDEQLLALRVTAGVTEKHALRLQQLLTLGDAVDEREAAGVALTLVDGVGEALALADDSSDADSAVLPLAASDADRGVLRDGMAPVGDTLALTDCDADASADADKERGAEPDADAERSAERDGSGDGDGELDAKLLDARDELDADNDAEDERDADALLGSERVASSLRDALAHSDASAGVPELHTEADGDLDALAEEVYTPVAVAAGALAVSDTAGEPDVVTERETVVLRLPDLLADAQPDSVEDGAVGSAL